MEREFDDDLEEVAAVNSEMRYLALELMKISTQRGVAFEQVVGEYIENTHKLKIALAKAESSPATAKKLIEKIAEAKAPRNTP
ncbi:hypothetical protein HY571_01190 [Candidatus Micrarchaeota archaeon]|nr:hypothetical protein [Candidatus Micrarchaeota archaeon]